MNKSKKMFCVVAMFLATGTAHAEILTGIKSVTGDNVQVPKGMECLIRERTLIFSGGESSLSGLFAEHGLLVTTNKKSDCVIVVGGNAWVQHKNNLTATLVSKLVNENDIMDDLMTSSNFSNQDKPKSIVGETVGAGVGSSFGLAGAAIGAIVGSVADSRKTKYLSASAASIRASLKFKDAQGKTVSREVEVMVTAKENTIESPIALLSAAVKLAVGEIHGQELEFKNTEAETVIIPTAPASIATNQEVQQ